jgi:hypothetical protein
VVFEAPIVSAVAVDGIVSEAAARAFAVVGLTEPAARPDP